MRLLLLYLFNRLFFLIITARNWLYNKKILPVCRIENTFIVSIGNIAVGGTGKTPLAIQLLEELKDLPTALITRGYKGNYHNKKLPLIVEATSLAKEVGDEPLVVKREVPSALVVVDPDRVRGARFAKEKGRTLLVLDDGMQHRRIARDLEIVVVNGEAPFEGWLREPPTELKRADIVVVMGGAFTPNDLPFIRMKRRLIGDLSGKKVGLFCGVGNPSQVLEMVKEAGAEVVEHWFLGDHATPSKEKLHDFAALCENRGAEILLCTEKDVVKLPSPISLALPLAVLQIRLEILEGANIWEEVLRRCRQGIIP